MIDINQFCGKDDIRSHLNAPFIVDNRIVATNGHVIIVMPNDGKNEYPQCPERFNAARVINIIESATAWVTANKDGMVLPEMVPCLVCRGTGKAKKIKCEECEGDGTVDAETDYSTYYDLQCASCGGAGYDNNLETDETCPDCNGSGKVYEPYACVEILGINVQEKYLRLIIDEESLEFSSAKENGMLAFRTGSDTIGAIMGCRI